MSMPIRTRMNV